jgi:hypothetical protein
MFEQDRELVTRYVTDIDNTVKGRYYNQTTAGDTDLPVSVCRTDRGVRVLH